MEKWFKEHKSQLCPLDRYKYIDDGGVYTGSQSVHNPGKMVITMILYIL